MTQAIAKIAAKKLLAKQMKQYKDKKVAGDHDPYYALIEDPRRPGRKKKVKKQIPDYIPEHDALILAKARRRAYWLDVCLFNFLGIRFGWSAVIGLIPMVGDAIDLLFAIKLVRLCNQVECDLDTPMMYILCFIDFGIGLIPVVGDLADASFRANTYNVRRLERALDKAYKPQALKKADSKKDKEHTPPPATVYEDLSDDDSEMLPMHRQDLEPSRPEPARVPLETRGGDRGNTRKGTLKKSDSRRRNGDDVEMARPSRGQEASSKTKNGRNGFY